MYMIKNSENIESWEDKAGNTGELGNSKLASPHLIFAPHFSEFTISKLQSLPHTFPLWKMLGSWYSEFVYIHVFVGIHEIIKSNQEDLKH